jgi:hypothetical protein
MTDEKKKKRKNPWDVEYDESVFSDPWPVEIDIKDLDRLKGFTERICDPGSLEGSAAKIRAEKLRDDAERLKKILEKKKKKT